VPKPPPASTATKAAPAPARKPGAPTARRASSKTAAVTPTYRKWYLFTAAGVLGATACVGLTIAVYLIWFNNPTPAPNSPGDHKPGDQLAKRKDREVPGENDGKDRSKRPDSPDKPKTTDDPTHDRPAPNPLAEQIQHLAKGDARAKEEAAKALGQMGVDAHPAIPALIGALNDSDRGVRDQAAAAIVAIGRRPTSVLLDFSATWCGPCRQMKPIVTRLEKEGLPIWEVDTDENTQLSVRYKVRAVPTFVLLKDDKEVDRTVGMTSEESLREMAAKAKGAAASPVLDLTDTASAAWLMALLIGRLDDDAWVQFAAGAVVRARGPKLVPKLTQVVTGKYPKLLRAGATAALNASDKDARPKEVNALLTRLAEDAKEATEVRGYAAVALSASKPANKQLVPVLTAALSGGEYADLRIRAAGRLGELRAAEAVPVLTRRLAAESGLVRRAILLALRDVGPESGPAIPALLALYKDPKESELQDSVRDALQQIVPSAKEAVPALGKALQDEDAALRILALDLLKAVDDPRPVVKGIRAALKDKELPVRIRCALLLHDMGERGDDIVRAVVDSLGEEKESPEATGALRTMGRKAVPMLANCVTGPNQPPRLRMRAARILSGMGTGSAAAIPQLTEALRSNDPQVRVAAALVLARPASKVKGVVDGLAAGLKSDDSNVRQECVRALGASRDKTAVAPLLATLREGDAQVRAAAGSALGSFDLDEAAVAALVDLLKKADTRKAAAMALYGTREHAPKAVPALIDALAASNEEDRYQVADALSNIGKPAVAHLLGLFEDPKREEGVRWEAVRILGRMGPAARDIAPQLAKHLKDPDRPARLRAAIALGQTGMAGEVIPVLFEALLDDDADLRNEAMQAFQVLGIKATDAVDRLCELMKAGEPEKRRAAIQAVAAAGRDSDRAAQELVNLLQKKEAPELRSAAAYALEGFGKRAVPPLNRALDDEAMSRPDVIQALQNLGHEARPAEPALARLLDDKDRSLAVKAALALARIEPKRAAAVDVLIEAGNSPDAQERASALSALGLFGKAARPAVPLLNRALRDQKTRGLALHSLRQLGPEAAEAVDALTGLLSTKDAVQAADALGAIGPAASPAVPSLLKLLDRGERTSEAAAGALGKIGGTAKQAIPVLLKKLEDPEQRLSACHALGQVGGLDPGQAHPGIRKLLKDPDAEVRVAAVWAVGLSKSADGIADLVKCLEDAAPSVRPAAAYALGRLGAGNADAVKALMGALQGQDPELRPAAATALGEIGNAAEPAVPLLIKSLEDKQTRGAAAYALGRLGAKAAKAIPRLIELVDDTEMRWSAIQALGQFGPLAKDALPKLRKMLKEADRDLSYEVQEAIKKIERRLAPPTGHFPSPP
jgi:HEAT repeat protein